MDDLLKANFEPKEQVKAESRSDPKSEYKKKAMESIGGSMVFVERELLEYDPEIR